MKEDQEVKHVCKLCNKIFSTGRSLGGHMRSHLISDENYYSKKKTSNLLVVESNSELDTLQVCKECGKSFPSWKSLFGHMKCHSTKIPSVKQEEEEQDYWNSEANYKKKRSFSSRKMKRYNMTETTLTSSTLTNDEEQEEEEDVAISLIMLSKDVGNFVGLIPNVTTSCSDADSQFLQTRSSNQMKFECTSCNKIFKSYQALGGHKASHKRSKRSDENSTISVDTTDVVEFGEANYVTIKKKKGYECPICFKIFTSGQALGGHKRSHLIAEAKSTIKNIEAVEIQKPEVRELLDLNIPAPIEEESSSTEYICLFFNNDGVLANL